MIILQHILVFLIYNSKCLDVISFQLQTLFCLLKVKNMIVVHCHTVNPHHEIILQDTVFLVLLTTSLLPFSPLFVRQKILKLSQLPEDSSKFKAHYCGCTVDEEA